MLLNPLESRTALQHALENQYAILAINADSPAAIGDCLEAALQMDAPVIIETSRWQLEGHSFGRKDAILGTVAYISQIALLANSPRYHAIPVIFHTDHIKGEKTISILESAILGSTLTVHDSSILLRASTISLDASELSQDKNIEIIKHLCVFSKQNNVPVTLEMEDAVDDGITTPETAKKLLESIESTYPGHIYLWAPGVGTQHGFGEKMNFNPKTIEAQVLLTKEITGRKIGIALHGSSGLQNEDLKQAARAGVVKVNWSTESLYIRSAAAKKYYEIMAAQLDKNHKDWKSTAMDNGVNEYIAKTYIPKVSERIKLLGGQNKANEIMKLLNDDSSK